MKIIRVFPRRTSHTPNDDMVFIGDPPLDRPAADEVHVSVTFTWDKPKAERLKLAWSQYYPVMKTGGPAYDDPGNGFTPGMYLKKGIVMTSRGCNNNCPPCLVHGREGRIRLLPITEGNIIQDNNLLQCPDYHIEAVFDMLKGQRKIQFTGGLDARLITKTLADKIRGLNIDQIFLACDTDGAIKPLRKATRLLGLSQNKLRCYVLLKHDPEETMLHATIRLLQVWEAGCIPFAQLYQPADHYIDYPVEWKRFARAWSRPAASRAVVRDILRLY